MTRAKSPVGALDRNPMMKTSTRVGTTRLKRCQFHCQPEWLNLAIDTSYHIAGSSSGSKPCMAGLDKAAPPRAAAKASCGVCGAALSHLSFPDQTTHVKRCMGGKPKTVRAPTSSRVLVQAAQPCTVSEPTNLGSIQSFLEVSGKVFGKGLFSCCCVFLVPPRPAFQTLAI